MRASALAITAVCWAAIAGGCASGPDVATRDSIRATVREEPAPRDLDWQKRAADFIRLMAWELEHEQWVRPEGEEAGQTVRLLHAILHSRGMTIWHEATAACLSKFGPEAAPAAGKLAELALAGHAGNRPHFVHALGEIGPAAGGVAPALTPLLVELPGGLRTAQTLARLGDGGRAALVAALDHEHPTHRGHAMHGIAALGEAGREYLPRLRAMAADEGEHAWTRRQAQKAIATLEAGD